MQLNLKSFSQLVQDMGAALQGSATNLVDVSVGSVVRAIFEANAAVVLWLQWLILQVLSMTRAATSNGSDLDTWMADFGVLRLPATSATGVVTFSRFSASLAALIPVGTTIKTADGSLKFSVAQDTSLSTWQQSSAGYVVPAGVTSTDLPAVCLTSGAIGNVLPGTVTLVASSLPGVDQVVNASAFTDGTDFETDQALRIRFQRYLSSLSRATITAIEVTISSVQQGIFYLIKENTAPDGTTRNGSFLIIIDDGSGYPSSTLLSAVATAVDLVRPIGTMFSVVPPIVLPAEVSLTASASVGVSSTYISSIEQQINLYLNSLAIERPASVTRLAVSAYAASPSIDNITSVMINGSTADLVPPPGAVVKAGQITVTFNVG